MQESPQPASQQLVIRIGQSTLALLLHDGHQIAHYEETVMRSGISTAANLRDWLKAQPLLMAPHATTTILLHTPTLIVPLDEFDTADTNALYTYTFSGHDRDVVTHTVLNDRHAVVVFGIDKDLDTVLTDQYGSCRWLPVCLPVWRRMGGRGGHHRERQRLHVYFHDGQADVFSFNGSHFKFSNQFPATHAKDALYYVLNAFTQQGMKATRDEVVVLGALPNRKWFVEQLGQYVGSVTVPELSTTQPDTSAWPTMPADLIFAINP